VGNKTTMKTLIKILFIIFPCLIWAATATPNKELTQLLSSFHSLQADFVQSINSNQHSSGKMALQRPGKFRWEIQEPYPQLIIADGKYIWIYDADLQQVTKQKMDYREANNPALLLSGSIQNLQKNFIITKLNQKPGEWFELRPKAKNGLFQKIQIQFISHKLTAMYIVDNLGQHSTLRFNHLHVNPKLNPKLFSFVPPKNVDVVEN
jgi:outer membrane lipoprotein carrier protein